MSDRVIINGREYRGYWTDVERTDLPGGEGIAVSATFHATHFEHFCIKCGKPGLVHLLGTFVSPADGREYAYYVCEDHEPVQKSTDKMER